MVTNSMLETETDLMTNTPISKVTIENKAQPTQIPLVEIEGAGRKVRRILVAQSVQMAQLLVFKLKILVKEWT